MLYRFVKRTLDIVFSSFFIIILSPLMLAIAVAVRIETPGAAIFKQQRLGKGGKVFTILKFRSMCLNAEATGTGVYSGEGDPRVTKTGRFIRATSLDELPQLFNIFAGQMSFIGPRPVLTYHPWPLSEYTEEQKRRFAVRPGITGYAQINGRKQTPWVTRIKYDLQYVDNFSLLTDIKILFLTVRKVFKREDNLSPLDRESGKAVPTNINTENESVGK